MLYWCLLRGREASLVRLCFLEQSVRLNIVSPFCKHKMVIMDLEMWAVMSSKITTHRSFQMAHCEEQT